MGVTHSSSSGAANQVIVTEKVISGEVDDLQWSKDGKVVFLLSDTNALYRSDDEGATWANQAEALRAVAGAEATDKSLGVKKIVISEKDDNFVIFVGTGANHFATKDGGKTYAKVNSKLPFHDIILHPTDTSLVLGSAMSKKCRSPEAEGLCYKNLYGSRDFGATWTFLTNYVVQFDWAHSLGRGQAAKGNIPVDSIFATVFSKKTGNQKFGYWDADINFVRSDDFFKTNKVKVKHGNRFLFTAKFLFVAQVNPKRQSEVVLRMSSDGAATFVKAQLPYAIKQHSYTILDTSEDSVFLHVNHQGDGAKWGNVYISDSLGLNYSLSLPHNRRDTNGKCDFEKIQGIEGIYMANFIDNINLEDGSIGDPTEVQESKGKGKKTSKAKKAVPRVRTVITFDKGAVWGYLRPPTVDAAGKAVDCDDSDCSLHLHGVTDDWGPFYSSNNAIGLIMATGNIGSSLSTHDDEINTYFSRDAGLTWYEVAKGSHIYEFGDHGALTVMANDEKATHHVIYSWNEGQTWETFKFSENPAGLEVDNIIIEPTATSQKFLVYGSRLDHDGKRVGVVYSLDFTGLHQRACTGIDAPGSDSSDYETWTPSDGRLGGQCLMGHTVSYIRRKRASECFNGQKVERSTLVKHCECTEMDYECDRDYERKVEGGLCQYSGKGPRNISNMIPKICPSGSSYSISNGYRKVAGDTCVGGVNRDASVFDCPHWTTTVSHRGWMVLGIVISLVLGLGYVTNKKQKAAMPGVSLFASIKNSIPCLKADTSRGFGGETRYQAVDKYTDGPETAANYDKYTDEFELADEDDIEPAIIGENNGPTEMTSTQNTSSNPPDLLSGFDDDFDPRGDSI
jgi:hypothetical protein